MCAKCIEYMQNTWPNRAVYLLRATSQPGNGILDDLCFYLGNHFVGIVYKLYIFHKYFVMLYICYMLSHYKLTHPTYPSDLDTFSLLHNNY